MMPIDCLKNIPPRSSVPCCRPSTPILAQDGPDSLYSVPTRPVQPANRETRMSKLTIYGTAASRTFRTLWAAKELGIDYDHKPVQFRNGECRTPEFRKINPNGHVPAIQDDKVTMFESLAINLYLAKKYPGAISPKTVEEDGLATQWSMWALTEAEPHIVALLMNRVMLPEDKRDASAAARAEEAVKAPLGVLNAALAGKDYLLGKGFTVADLNLASVISTARRV
ncbi:MAG: glutathione S-transferase family protein, partial [Alphaproteobacteria bacterium]|nr:glutathione S-transferase family protein [Alphaproteobacteria bacterium]